MSGRVSLTLRKGTFSPNMVAAIVLERIEEPYIVQAADVSELPNEQILGAHS